MCVGRLVGPVRDFLSRFICVRVGLVHATSLMSVIDSCKTFEKFTESNTCKLVSVALAVVIFKLKAMHTSYGEDNGVFLVSGQ